MAEHECLLIVSRTERFGERLVAQNIFCNFETGEVTCIIDWERASTVPRCIGYASLPIFLTPDWFPDYSFFTAPHAPWALDMYRCIYADAMIEETGSEDDGRFTYKSAMYQAAHAALYGSSTGGSYRDFLHKVLREIKGLRGVDTKEFLDWMGEVAFESGLEFAKEMLPGVLAP